MFRLEAQLAQALKDNASLQKYQKDAQKQAELKQMIEGMISKVLDMETQLVQVTKYEQQKEKKKGKVINMIIGKEMNIARNFHNSKVLVYQTVMKGKSCMHCNLY